MEQGRERYIVAGKLVEPAEDILLCRVEISADILGEDPFESGRVERIYATEQGLLYMVIDHQPPRTEVKEISESEAGRYLASHADSVNIEGYQKAFGKLERG